MICSSLNLVRFIAWSSPKGPDSTSTWIRCRGQRQRFYDLIRYVFGGEFLIVREVIAIQIGDNLGGICVMPQAIISKYLEIKCLDELGREQVLRITEGAALRLVEFLSTLRRVRESRS
jgi:hypothetical protein